MACQDSTPPERRCTKCGETKPIEMFCLNRRKKCGRESTCRSCVAAADRLRRQNDPVHMSARRKISYQKNRTAILAGHRKYVIAHKEKIREYLRQRHIRLKAKHAAYCAEWQRANPQLKRELQRQWEIANPEKVRTIRQRGNPTRQKRKAIRRKEDKQYALGLSLRSRVQQALKLQSARKAGPTEKLIGCTIPKLMSHLERLFLPGMTWENRRAWHIDHIRPCAAFDLTDPDQQRACFHYTNLQPLWARDNILKGARDLRKGQLRLILVDD